MKVEDLDKKNALLSAGLISILGELYGDQFQTLILASQPERLGVNGEEFFKIHLVSQGMTLDLIVGLFFLKGLKVLSKELTD